MLSIKELYKIFLNHPVVITDSRKIEKGCLFFALKGERFDGNDYANLAIENGAAYAIIDNPKIAKDSKFFLLVGDVLKTLQQLSVFHRAQFDIPIIAITGTNGKTTTKELVSKVLATQYKTHFTKGNLNNHIGVPLTLLSIPLNIEVVVIEMGANHQGEITFLCEIANPTHGIITNIGKAHLEGFGDLDGVKRAKAELYQFIQKKGGVIFINKDEPFLSELASPNQRKLYYLKSENPNHMVADYEVKFLASDPYVRVAFLSWMNEIIEVKTQLIGRYNFNNIMTAIALGKYFKVPAKKIKSALENYIPTNNRSQIVEKETNTYILDAYNANPTSTKLALQSFKLMNRKNKIVILGDMLELGISSSKEHREIIDFANECFFDQLIFVGKEYIKVLKQGEHSVFQNVLELKLWFEKQNFKNTWFLVKGSRGMKLEQLLSKSFKSI